MAAVAGTTSCTRNEDTARVNIQLPGSLSLSQKGIQAATVSGKVGSLGLTWNGAIPTALSDMGCFGVFVGGSEADMSANSCKDGDGNVLARFGIMKGFMARGTQMSLDVKPGARKVYIFGSKLVSGSCPDVFAGSEPNVTGLSYPYLLGQANVDLKPGVTSDVSINLAAIL
jgi:hypothetical protein